VKGVRKIEVSADEEGSRLDRWLAKVLPYLSHGLRQKLVRTGQVRVDGARAAGNFRLSAGQQIRIPPVDGLGRRVKGAYPKVNCGDARNLLSRVLFESDDLIVIDKPAGMAVQGGTGQYRHIDNLSQVLVHDDEPAPKLVHRLDKDTSGVMLLAKSADAARRLGKKFKTGLVRKKYWAVVVGVPTLARGFIENEVEKRGGVRGDRVLVVPNQGRRARTRYQMLDRSGSTAAFLALYPETGRTHQLRVHCLGLGTPILGDGKYGGKHAFLDNLASARRLHLHARSIQLTLEDGTDLCVVAEMPEHMLLTVRSLAFDTGE